MRLPTLGSEVVDVGVQVLGPTRLDGGETLAPRDRVILSALCVRPGQVVSAETLADALWGDEPPKSSGKVVQGAVMRLRRALGPATIETTLGGYRLCMPTGELDTVEFERLVARGREFQALHEPERAATTFAQALAMWQGHPFGELLDWDPARAEAARLLDVRRAVEEDLVEAHLAAVHAAEAAAEAGPLVAREPFRERRWALLATALYRTGRQGDALAVLRRASRTMRDELGLDPGPQLVELEQRMLQQDETLLDVPNRMGGAGATCPYRGLRPFDTEDADFYFGRAGTVAEAVRRLAGHPLLVVAGPSGSGKSSFVRAGVMPALTSTGHPAAVLTPGPDPLAALAGAVANLEPRGVLVVDQLEEVFVHAAGDRIHQFLDRMATLVDGGTMVLATLRADYLGWLAESPRLAHLAEGGLLLLTPLTDDELREAIEAPARLLGLHLEPGLVDLLVREVSAAPGGLPLLSHALAETWEHREGTVLTVEGYRATGGIQSAVAQSAERLYESLDPADRVVLRSVLERLVTPTPAGEPVAARVPTRVFAGSPEAPRLLDLLVRSRLVTAMDDCATIAHESLVRAWPRLRTWLDEDIEGQRIRAHLQVAADGWDSLGRPDEELYRGARLASAREWQARAHPMLSPVEEAFLAAAAEHADAERLHVERTHAEQVRRNRQLRGALAAVVVLLLVSLLAGTQAGLRGRQAQAAATRADASATRADASAVDAQAARLGATAVAESNTALSLLLARQAVAIAEDSATEGALLQTLLNTGGLVGLAHPRIPSATAATRDHAFSPDGRRLLRLDSRGAVHLIDTTSGKSVAGPLAGSDAGYTFVDDGVHPVGLIDGGRVALVSQEPPAPRASSGPWHESDENRGILVASYRTATGEPVGAAQPVPGAVSRTPLDHDRLRVSPDGRTLVSVLERTVRIWHLRDGGWVGPARVPLADLDDTFPDQDIPLGVTFSADGSRAAVQMILQAPPFYVGQRVAFVVDTVRHRLVGPVLKSRNDGSGLWQTSLSPDGRLLLVGDFGRGIVRVRDVETGKVLTSIPGGSPASALAWSSDSRSVAIGRIDGSREAYSLSPMRRLARFTGSELVLTIAFTGEDGLAVQDSAGAIARYDMSSLSPVARSVSTDRIHEVAVAGQTIAVGGDDGHVSLYDRADLSRIGDDLWLGPYPQHDPTVAPAVHRRVSALAVLPDESAVIAADRTGHLRMWSLPERALLWSRDDVPTATLAVSPNGRYLATLGYTPGDSLPDGGALTTTLTIWDLAGRVPILDEGVRPPPEYGSEPSAPKPRSVVFSPDSRRVAATFYGDSVVRVYDLQTARRHYHQSLIVSSTIAFTPDSARLVGVFANDQWGRLAVWDADTGNDLASASAPRMTDLSRMLFTTDGRWLVVSHDRSLTILDGRTLQVVLADLPLPNDGTNDAFALAPTEDGHIVVGTQNTLVDLDLNPETWKPTTCRLAGRVLTSQEWARFLAPLPFHPACH